MPQKSNIKLTIHFNNPDITQEESDKYVQQLMTDLREVDEVDVSRVPDPNPPEGSKSMGGLLTGILTAEVNVGNVKQLFGFLSNCLSGKMIELEVEFQGKKLKVKAQNCEELEAAIKAAQDFINAEES